LQSGCLPVHPLHGELGVERRDFIRALSAGGLSALVAAPDRVLRIGTVGAMSPETRGGLDFGLSESARSAALLGWRTSVVDMDSAGASNVSAAIAGRTMRALPRDLPVVGVTCDAPGQALVIAPCDVPVPAAAPGEELQVSAWHHTLERYGAAQLNDRFHSATHAHMTGDAWVGWFAAKVLTESALRVGSVDPAALMSYLRDPATMFDGHKGVGLRFDARGRLRQPLYLLKRRSGSAEWELDREIPIGEHAS